jgi:hypothetical protein
MIRVRGPYLDCHDLWVGLFWRPRPAGGVRLYFVPLPALVIRVDIRTGAP